jgi:hypothetical protein
MVQLYMPSVTRCFDPNRSIGLRVSASPVTSWDRPDKPMRDNIPSPPACPGGTAQGWQKRRLLTLLRLCAGERDTSVVDPADRPIGCERCASSHNRAGGWGRP